MLLLASLLLSTLVSFATAKTVTYDWDVTWVTASPDGFERPVIGINGEWPVPILELDKGDHVVVNLNNKLGNQSTSIHWHGITQYGTNTMDGSSGATQCPIPPGSSFTYDFTVRFLISTEFQLAKEIQINQAGTFWYHSHTQGQYPDGLRGMIIVHDSDAPYANQYDEEITISLSDWYHGQMPDLIYNYQSVTNENNGGNEPIPDSMLVNDGINTQIKVQPGKTYLMHIVNVGNWAGQAIIIDGHNLTVVEVDGVYVDAAEVGSKDIRVATGQRWTFLMDTKDNADRNFAIWVGMDVNMLLPPPGYNPNTTAYLVYDEDKPLPPALEFYEFDFFDDMTLTPSDHMPLLEPVDHQIVMNTGWTSINGIQR